MCLVGDDHDVAPIGQFRELLALVRGEELLDGREHDATGCDLEQLAEVVAVTRLNGDLAQQLTAPCEGSEQLVVEVVAVGDHNDRRVLHCGVVDDSTRVERHGQTLARSLRVPDDAHLAIAARSRGANRLGDGLADRSDLVVARQLLHHAVASILEDDEALDQVEKATLLEHPGEERAQLQRPRRGHLLAIHGAPGREPLPGRAERADPGHHAIRGNEQLVVDERRADLLLVGLELVERVARRGVLIGGVLQLDDGERQTVQEDEDVRTPVMVPLDDGELVDGEPVILIGGIEVGEAQARRERLPVLAGDLDPDRAELVRQRLWREWCEPGACWRPG